MTARFKNKVVAIAGGSDGTGLATAKRFASEGAHVYFMGRRQDRLDEAAAEIGHGAVASKAMFAAAAISIGFTKKLKMTMDVSMSCSPMRAFRSRHRSVSSTKRTSTDHRVVRRS